MTMFEQSQQSDWLQTELELMSSQEDSPAKTSQSQETKQALKVSAVDYGQSAPVLLGSFDPDTPSLKTSQTCLTESGELGLSEFSGTFPRSGMMRSGTVYQLPNLARTITEIGSGLSATQERFYWRTPDTGSGGTPKALLEGKTHRESGNAIQVRLSDQVKMWPTPSTRDYKGGYIGGRIRNGKVSWDTLDVAVQHTDNQEKTNGTLNPTWVEWLMGFPIGHTDLNA